MLKPVSSIGTFPKLWFSEKHCRNTCEGIGCVVCQNLRSHVFDMFGVFDVIHVFDVFDLFTCLGYLYHKNEPHV